MAFRFISSYEFERLTRRQKLDYLSNATAEVKRREDKLYRTAGERQRSGWTRLFRQDDDNEPE
jgi:hypothetical protein